MGEARFNSKYLAQKHLVQKYFAAILLTFSLVFSIKSNPSEKAQNTLPTQNILSPTKSEPANSETHLLVKLLNCNTTPDSKELEKIIQKEFNAEKVEVEEVSPGEEEIKEPTQTFGLELTLDLFDCNKEIIDSKEKILEFSEKLCDLIDMKRYGKPFIERFADGTDAEGYSLAQMIETSLVSGHFAPVTNSAYINIFSCKSFDPEVAEKFTKEFFGAKRVKSKNHIR